MRIPRSPGSARALLAPFIATAFLWPTSAAAYRPFNSTDAAVAARGEAEVELGPVGLTKVGPERTLIAPNLVLNWGFADRWEAVVEGRHAIALGARVDEPRFRLEDPALNLKGVLREGSLQGKAGMSVATELGMLLPEVDGAHGAGAQGGLIVSQRWDALTVHANAHVAWTRAHVPGLFGGVVAEGPDTWAIRPVAELLVEGERDGATTRSALVGAIWRVREGLSLDAALRTARVGREELLEIRAGFTWSFSVGVPR